MRLTKLVACLAFLLSTSQSWAISSLDKRVNAATEVIEQMTKMPEKGIPPNLLSSAYAMAVIPNSIKAGFLLGGSFGKGVLVVRQADGSWSNPAFINLGGGSFGWQAGAQSTDIVLVFKNRKGVENIAKGKVKLGADANIAAGPVGRHTQAATDGRLRAEIYAYSRNRGLFAGVSLEGTWMGMDKRANFAYYDNSQGNAATILSDMHMPSPAQARRFIDVLEDRAPALKEQAVASRPSREERPAREDDELAEGIQTYAIDDAPSPQTDTLF